MIQELIPVIDSNYRTKRISGIAQWPGFRWAACKRCRITLRHLDQFAWIGAMSGPPRQGFDVKTSYDGVFTNSFFNQKVKLLWLGAGNQPKLKFTRTLLPCTMRWKVPGSKTCSFHPPEPITNGKPGDAACTTWFLVCSTINSPCVIVNACKAFAFVFGFVSLLGFTIWAGAATAPDSQTLQQAEPLTEPGWFPFDPAPDPFTESPIDLRFLNEKFAGEHGFIAAKDGHFIHSASGQPVRFWAVNGPPQEKTDRAALHRTARSLPSMGSTWSGATERFLTMTAT
jgi:hypothetical protein